MILSVDRTETPLGTLVIVCDAAGALCAVDWEDHADRMDLLLNRRAGSFELRPAANPAGLTDRFRAYFAGELAAIEGLPTAPTGTPFQRAVWAALPGIPAGEAISYGTLAARLGCPAAVRAVGRANGANPVSIAVPCHRVIGANGTLTGYGGGLHRKAWLLAHEGWKGAGGRGSAQTTLPLAR